MKELDFIRMVRGDIGVRRELFKVAVIFFLAFMMGALSMAMSGKMLEGRLSSEAKQNIIDSADDNVLIFRESGGIIEVKNISSTK